MEGYQHGFFLGLPKAQKDNDYIFVVVDKLIEKAQLIPCRTLLDATNVNVLFFKEIIRLHGLSSSINFDTNS
jgi:hypothetical protein